MTAIEKAGYTGRIQIAMDVAASEFYKDGKYDLDFKNPDSDPNTWVNIIASLNAGPSQSNLTVNRFDISIPRIPIQKCFDP